MGIPHETPGFNALQREWYSKLKATGFRDIEPASGYMSDHYLEMRRVAQRGAVTGGAELFRVCEKYTNVARWHRRTERWLWNAWCVNGWTPAELTAKWPKPWLTEAGTYSRLMVRKDEALAHVRTQGDDDGEATGEE